MPNNSKTKRGTKFVYQRPSPEQILRTRHILRFDDYIDRAYHGNTKQLYNYLRQPDLPLEEGHREKLAELIYRQIGKNRRGPNPKREAELDVVAEVLRLRQQKFGAKRAPWSAVKALTDQVLENNAERFDGLGVDRKNIDRELKRGAPKP